MNTLQRRVQDYLEADDFKLLDARDGFVVANRPGARDAHDTLLLWFPPSPAHVNDFTQIKRRLLREFEATIPNYPDAKYYVVAETLEGLSSPDFFPEAKRLRV